MSSTRHVVRRLALALSCVMTLPPGVVAQQAASVAEQSARVARLDRLRQLAVLASDSAEKAVGTRWPPDTVRLGPLTVLTDRAGATVVRAGVNLAWQQLSPTFGSDTSVLRSEWLFVSFRETPSRPRPGRNGVHVGWSTPMTLKDATPNDVANEVQRLVGERFGEEWDRSFTVNGHRLSRWPGGYTPMPLPRDSALRGQTYVEMVTVPSQVTHRCFDGDVVACRVALGLDSVADPVTAWYSATQRLLLAKRLEPTYGQWYYRGRESPLVHCTTEHDDASCIAFLRDVSGNATDYSMIWPLSSRARQSVMLVAVTMGGSGAYARLVTDRSKNPGGRLAAAARVPLDSVISVWRTQVIAARPLSPEVTGGTQWSTLLWAVVFAVLALRSTRWRSA